MSLSFALNFAETSEKFQIIWKWVHEHVLLFKHNEEIEKKHLIYKWSEMKYIISYRSTLLVFALQQQKKIIFGVFENSLIVKRRRTTSKLNLKVYWDSFLPFVNHLIKEFYSEISTNTIFPIFKTQIRRHVLICEMSNFVIYNCM